MEKLDLARIREYNKELREAKQKSADAVAQINMNKKELDRLCQELSAELNTLVNADNIEKIYEVCVSKIKSELATGEEILRRIKNEDSAVENITESNFEAPKINMANIENNEPKEQTKVVNEEPKKVEVQSTESLNGANSQGLNGVANQNIGSQPVNASSQVNRVNQGFANTVVVEKSPVSMPQVTLNSAVENNTNDGMISNKPKENEVQNTPKASWIDDLFKSEQSKIADENKNGAINKLLGIL